MRGQRGFTLIEVVVVAAVIAILAGILVPIVINQIDEARLARARSDCRSIATAVSMFRKDLGKWPYYMPGDCSQTYLTLQGDGNPPGNDSGDWQISLNDISLALILNLPANMVCYANKAPTSYLPEVTPDPWGNMYVVNAADFASTTNPVWVISAGPNGCLDTTVNSLTLNDVPCTAGPADDIGVRIK